MTLNENSIRELLDQATPGPWHVAMLDLHRETGVIDNEHAVANQRLAALAPELARDWFRMRSDLGPVELVTTEDFENAPVGTIVSYPRVSAYQKIANGKWESPNSPLTNGGMASVSPWKVLRWGWGEQQ